MTHALHVWANEAQVATIEHGGRDDRWGLSYAEPWVADAKSYPLSPALPLVRPAADYASASIKRFIEHLLPEGRALEAAVAYNGLASSACSDAPTSRPTRRPHGWPCCAGRSSNS